MGRRCRRLRLPFRRRSTRPPSQLVRQQYCPCLQYYPLRAAMGRRCRRMRHHSPFRRLLMPPCLQSLPASVVGPSLALRMRQELLLLRLCEVVPMSPCASSSPVAGLGLASTPPSPQWPCGGFSGRHGGWFVALVVVFLRILPSRQGWHAAPSCPPFSLRARHARNTSCTPVM